MKGLNDLIESDSPHLKLWRKVSSVPSKYVKEVGFGKRKFSNIDAYFQAATATAEWGMYGEKWGLRNSTITMLQSQGIDKSGTSYTEQTMLYQAEFFYPGEDGEASFPIEADLKFRAGDDTAKKCRTTAQSKALSLLGFGADVYWGNFDDAAFQKKNSSQWGIFEKAKHGIAGIDSADDLDERRVKIESMHAEGKMDEVVADAILELIEERREQLLAS